MKKLLVPIFIFLFTQANSQQPNIARLSFIDSLLGKYRDITDSMYKTNWKGDPDTSKLVSNYTFRKLVQRDFSKITIGENSFSKIGRFATVSVNTTESKFYFTPFTLVNHADPLKGSFKHIFSVDFSGAINDKKIFEFDSKYTLKSGFSWTFIDENYAFGGDEKTADKIARINFHEKIVNGTYDKTLKTYKSAYNDLSQYVTHIKALDPSIKDSVAKLEVKKTFFSNLYDLEEKFYEDKWERKRIAWWKINVIPISWDNFSMLDTAAGSGMVKPMKKNLYSPSLKLSYNYYVKYPVNELYLSGFVGIGKKHTLSEVTSTSQWYQYKALTDSTFTVADNQKVYSLKPAELKEAFKPEFGGQLIWLINMIPNFNFGIDLSSSYGWMVGQQSGAAVSKNSVGILFPFLDKEGKSTVNLEFFYQAQFYIKSDLSNDSGWGLKFGLPFNRL